MVAREALSRAPGPEKVLDKFEFPPPPAKPKRAPFTPTRIAPSWGCRDSSTRSVWCFTESMCGRDSELVNSGCRSRPGTLSPPRSFLLQGKADTRWSQHFPPTYPKPGTELSSECHRGWRCQYTEGSSPREAITKQARTATKQGACAVCQALC